MFCASFLGFPNPCHFAQKYSLPPGSPHPLWNSQKANWLLVLQYFQYVDGSTHNVCFDNTFCPLLDGCQKTFLPKIFESVPPCSHTLICCMNSCKLTDTFQSMTHHAVSIYMNGPLSVRGFKGVISVSGTILDGFIVFIFIFLTQCFNYGEWTIPSCPSKII